MKVITLTLNPAIDKTILIDKFSFGDLNRVKAVRMDAGGKGINVAKVLKKFGTDVIATGLSAGFQGQRLLGYLQEEGIANDFLILEGETRVNLKVIDAYTNITTEINESGFNVDKSVLESFEEKLSKHLDDADILVLAGSLPPGVPKDIYRKYINMAKEKNLLTILDADGETLLEGIKACPYAIKPNIHELQALIGRELKDDYEVTHAAKQLINNGIKLVIVSMGGEGSIVVDEKEAFRVKPFPITPKSTVGAGDSMVAVLTYNLIQKDNLETIARWVTTAGTITASKSGTQVCSKEEIIKFLDKVNVTKL